MKYITKEEAFKALEQGEAVAHSLFSLNEWIYNSQDELFFKDEVGTFVNKLGFWMWRNSEAWEKGWYIKKVYKYFFFGTDFKVYKVPAKYFYCIDIINSKRHEHSDFAVNEAIKLIIENCPVKMTVHAVSTYL